jgi:Ca2+-binding EF-hand superfamily protein
MIFMRSAKVSLMWTPQQIRAAVFWIGLVVLVHGVLGVTTIAQTSQDRRSRDSDDSEDRSERRRQWREESRSTRQRTEPSGTVRGANQSSRPSSKSSPDEAGKLQMSDYAKSLVKQHDKNSNMMLDGEERDGLRGPAATADLNSDGTITVDELVARLSNSATAAKEPTASASASPTAAAEKISKSGGSSLFASRGGEESRKESSQQDNDSTRSKRVLIAIGRTAGDEAKAKRNSHRFTPAAEKLPSGLPSWFKSRDTNGDAQVSMSEYSRSWSDRLVAEFRRYDLNDDGMITATETAP